MTPELISFAICPFVQRAVIALNEKGTPFEITYIDLNDPPDWFGRLSPLGKVPLLKVGDEVLFESSIINEYLDEVYPPQLHPADPLTRARHRGWVEYASHLLFEQVGVLLATDESECQRKSESLGGALARLADELGRGPYFDGAAFSLVDCAFAPFFMRFRLLQQRRAALGDLLTTPLADWSAALLARPSVADSVVDDFERQFVDFFRAKGSLILADG